MVTAVVSERAADVVASVADTVPSMVIASAVAVLETATVKVKVSVALPVMMVGLPPLGVSVYSEVRFAVPVKVSELELTLAVF